MLQLWCVEMGVGGAEKETRDGGDGVRVGAAKMSRKARWFEEGRSHGGRQTVTNSKKGSENGSLFHTAGPSFCKCYD